MPCVAVTESIVVEPLKIDTLCGCVVIDGIMQTEIVIVELLTGDPQEPVTRIH